MESRQETAPNTIGVYTACALPDLEWMRRRRRRHGDSRLRSEAAQPGRMQQRAWVQAGRCTRRASCTGCLYRGNGSSSSRRTRARASHQSSRSPATAATRCIVATTRGVWCKRRSRSSPRGVVPAVRAAAATAATAILSFDRFTRIDNQRDANAGTGTSTSDWREFVCGEGGVMDWVVSPGRRSEYDKEA